MSDCEICPDCGALMLIEKQTEQGKTTFFCPNCQKRKTT